MKNLGNHWIVLFFCATFLVMGCGGSSNGTISTTLNLTLTQAEQDAIGHFVFLIQSPGSTSSTLFPSSCLSSSGGSACILASACGFTPAQDTFDPNLDFNTFAEGSTVQVTACALDGGSNYIGAGTTTVLNSDGQSATINLDNATACVGLPLPCM